MRKIFSTSICLSALLIILFFYSCSTPEDNTRTHLENAKKYFAAGEYEKAKIEFQNVTQIDQGNDVAFFYLGEIYIHLQKPLKAITSFSQAITLNPDNLKAQLRLGQIWLVAEKTKKARAIANEILKKDPDNIEGLHFLSDIQIQERNLPQALKTLKRAVLVAPENQKTHYFIAHLLYSMNRLDEAEPYYLKAIDLDKKLRASYMELAQLYKKKGEFEKIEPLLNQWIEIPGDQVQKKNDLALFRKARGRFDAAEETFLNAIVTSPENVDSLVNLATFYARHKKNDKALEIFLKALNIDKENPDIQAKIATLLFEQKQYKKAETTVDAILAREEKHELANLLKGRLYLARKNFSEALKYFEIVISQAPGHAMARYFKARSLLDAGTSNLPGQDIFRVAAGYSTAESWERKLAKDELLEAVKIDPGFINAHLLLIDIYLQDENKKLASQHIESVFQKEPKNLQALIFSGKLKLLEKDLDGAKKIFLTVLELNPDFSAGYVSLGLALHGMKKTQDALGAFDKALEINPGQIDALSYKVGIFLQEHDVAKALYACNEHRQKFKPGSASLASIDFIEGRIFMTAGKVEKAKNLFFKAIERQPAFLAPYGELAYIYESQNQISMAIQNYEKILELKPDYLPTYLNLFRIYIMQGDVKKAQRNLRDALAIKSDYAPAANNLAFMLAENESSLYEALRLSKIAVDEDPKNPDYLDTLGWIYHLQGSNDLALNALEESINLNPSIAITHYHIGWVYYDTQKFEDARKHMAKALEFDSDFDGSDKARDILGE